MRASTRTKNGSYFSVVPYAANHSASDAGRKQLETIACELGELEDAVRRAGSWAKYKADVAALLTSKDQAVRGYCAIWLADLGDPTYVHDLETLLKTDYPTQDDLPINGWDRGRALEGLGVLGAKDHEQELCRYLKSSNRWLRVGAAEGLSWMPAKDRQPDIARLLKDREGQVAAIACLALARLDAKQYAGRLTKIARHRDDLFDTYRYALFALATLKADDQAPKIAAMLKSKKHPKRRGPAMACLALMGCSRYAEQMASLMADQDVFTRQAAILSLGILGEDRFADRIAPLLVADDRGVQQAAACSLLLMNSKPHAAAAVEVYDRFETQQQAILSVISEVERKRLQQRLDAAIAELKPTSK